MNFTVSAEVTSLYDASGSNAVHDDTVTRSTDKLVAQQRAGAIGQIAVNSNFPAVQNLLHVKRFGVLLKNLRSCRMIFHIRFDYTVQLLIRIFLASLFESLKIP